MGFEPTVRSRVQRFSSAASVVSRRCLSIRSGSGFPPRLSFPNIPSGAEVLSSKVKSAAYSAQRVSVLRKGFETIDCGFHAASAPVCCCSALSCAGARHRRPLHEPAGPGLGVVRRRKEPDPGPRPRVFRSYDDIVDHCCYAWDQLTDQPWTIMSIGLRDWAQVGQTQ